MNIDLVVHMPHITSLHNCFCYSLIISYNKNKLRQSSIKFLDTYKAIWLNILKLKTKYGVVGIILSVMDFKHI